MADPETTYGPDRAPQPNNSADRRPALPLPGISPYIYGETDTSRREREFLIECREKSVSAKKFNSRFLYKSLNILNQKSTRDFNGFVSFANPLSPIRIY